MIHQSGTGPDGTAVTTDDMLLMLLDLRKTNDRNKIVTTVLRLEKSVMERESWRKMGDEVEGSKGKCPGLADFSVLPM